MLWPACTPAQRTLASGQILAHTGHQQNETDLFRQHHIKYNVDQLGEIPIEREDGTMRIMVCQMGGCTVIEVKEIKMSTTEKLFQKYDVNLVACMELNFNWSKVNSLANLASWLD